MIDVIDFIGTGIAQRGTRGPRLLNDSSQRRERSGIMTAPARRFNNIIYGQPFPVMMAVTSGVAVLCVGGGGRFLLVVLSRHQIQPKGLATVKG